MVTYKTAKQPITIICSIHGLFYQTPDDHVHGAGCVKCYEDRQRLGEVEFIRRSIDIHGAKYDYSEVEYTNI